MALHREIFWVGRQWAVTGYGLQACDQKQKGKFDIEASRLWEDGLLERLRGERWLNAEDFDKALAIARKQYPAPPRKAPPSADRAPNPIETIAKETPKETQKENPKENPKQTPKETPTETTKAIPRETPRETRPKKTRVKESPIEQPKPAAQVFSMRIESWPAKFLPQWRVRIKR